MATTKPKKTPVIVDTDTPDRITFSLSRSEKDYGSGIDVHISYSSNIEPGETPDDALNRVGSFIKKAVKAEFKVLKKLFKAGKL